MLQIGWLERFVENLVSMPLHEFHRVLLVHPAGSEYRPLGQHGSDLAQLLEAANTAHVGEVQIAEHGVARQALTHGLNGRRGTIAPIHGPFGSKRSN